MSRETKVNATGDWLDDMKACSFHWSADHAELTIRAPEGFKIGLPMADGIKALSSSDIIAARRANGGRGQF